MTDKRSVVSKRSGVLLISVVAISIVVPIIAISLVNSDNVINNIRMSNLDATSWYPGSSSIIPMDFNTYVIVDSKPPGEINRAIAFYAVTVNETKLADLIGVEASFLYLSNGSSRSFRGLNVSNYYHSNYDGQTYVFKDKATQMWFSYPFAIDTRYANFTYLEMKIVDRLA